MKTEFQGLDPHPMFHVAKTEQDYPAPFEVTYLNYIRDTQLPSIAFGKIVFYNPYSVQKYTTTFQYKNIPLFHKYCTVFLYVTHAIPTEVTDTKNYLSSDDPNYTNLMVSH